MSDGTNGGGHAPAIQAGADIGELVEVAPRLLRKLHDLRATLWALRGPTTPESAERAERLRVAMLRQLGHAAEPRKMTRRQIAADMAEAEALLRTQQRDVVEAWAVFAPAFEQHRTMLAGLVHKPRFECLGAIAASACELLHQQVRGLPELFSAPSRMARFEDFRGCEILLSDELRIGVDVEVAELQRTEQRAGRRKAPAPRDDLLPGEITMQQVLDAGVSRSTAYRNVDSKTACAASGARRLADGTWAFDRARLLARLRKTGANVGTLGA